MTFVPGIGPPIAPEKRVWFVVHDGGLILGPESSFPRDEDLAALGADPAASDYLGQLNDAHAFAVTAVQAPPAPFQIRGLRTLFGIVDDEIFGVAGRAVQIAAWATTHRYCGRCATPTVKEPAERAMRCPACKLVFYPRIAPAIIVLVRRGPEALLARGSRFPLPFYSTLAGFSEAGETLEETLAREVREEVGISVKAIRYFGSQPWPFPNSLMIGFHAEYAGGELRPDPAEILDAQWYKPDALPTIPPRLSIARKLIDTWLNEDIIRRMYAAWNARDLDGAAALLAPNVSWPNVAGEGPDAVRAHWSQQPATRLEPVRVTFEPDGHIVVDVLLHGAVVHHVFRMRGALIAAMVIRETPHV